MQKIIRKESQHTTIENQKNHKGHKEKKGTNKL